MSSLDFRVSRLERACPHDLDTDLNALSSDELEDLLDFVNALQSHRENDPDTDLSPEVVQRWDALSPASRALIERMQVPSERH